MLPVNVPYLNSPLKTKISKTTANNFMNQSMLSDYHQNGHSKYLSKTNKNVQGSYSGLNELTAIRAGSRHMFYQTNLFVEDGAETSL